MITITGDIVITITGDTKITITGDTKIISGDTKITITGDTKITTDDTKFIINRDTIITITGSVSCSLFITVTITSEFSTLSSHSSSLRISCALIVRRCH